MSKRILVILIVFICISVSFNIYQYNNHCQVTKKVNSLIHNSISDYSDYLLAVSERLDDYESNKKISRFTVARGDMAGSNITMFKETMTYSLLHTITYRFLSVIDKKHQSNSLTQDDLEDIKLFNKEVKKLYDNLFECAMNFKTKELFTKEVIGNTNMLFDDLYDILKRQEITIKDKDAPLDESNDNYKAS